MRRIIASLLYIKTAPFRLFLGLFFIVWSITLFSQSSQSDGDSDTPQAKNNVIAEQASEQLSQWYTRGLSAYLAGQYDVAYNQWLKAAEQKHAKSLFNLGRMWLDGKVYGEPRDSLKATKLFEQAAQLGYSPAKNMLDNLDRYSQHLSSQTLAQNDNKTSWVIQIFASKDVQLVESIRQKNGITSESYIIQEQVEGTLWYKLIYGEYVSKDQAMLASQSLPETLQEYNPWLRKASSLKIN